MMIENYRDIPGFEGLYSVSNFGNVYSHKSKRVLKPIKSTQNRRSKYHTFEVCLYRNNERYRQYVHTLVLMTFICPRPEGHVVRHLDNDTSNNRLSNIVWGTPRENIMDQLRSNTKAVGERVPQSRLKETQVREILTSFSVYEGPVMVFCERYSETFTVSYATIWDIIRRKSWKHVNV